MLRTTLKAIRLAGGRVTEAVVRDASALVVHKLAGVMPEAPWSYRFGEEEQPPALRAAEHGLCLSAHQACATAGYRAAGVEELLLAVAEGKESRVRSMAASAGAYVAGLAGVAFVAAAEAFAQRAAETRERRPYEGLHEEFGGTLVDRYDEAHGLFGTPGDAVSQARGGIFG